MTNEIRSVELSTGVELQYVEQGDPSAVPVLLLHGVSDSWHSFELVLPHLPVTIRALAITQRGHGDSSKPETGYGADDFASDAAAFLDALDLEAAVVVGHSMSSAVARRLAIHHPRRTLGLVLAASFATPRDNSAVRELWEEVARLEDPVDPGFVREFQESTLTRPVPEAFFQTVVQESLKVPARVWKDVIGSDVRSDYLEGVDSIHVPTLLIWGDRDEHCPRSDQEALAAAIPNARLVVYEGVGHAVHWEAPERFASDLVECVENVAS
jgi:non-heme chloroperoxidase